MRTLVLGGTGSIGGAVTSELSRHGHEVVALARSDAAEAKLLAMGVDVIRGDIRRPKEWSPIVQKVDAVIHVAATFTDDMGEVDRELVDAMLREADHAPGGIRFLYTGGCWLYGETGDNIADEATQFDPIPAFAWMIDNGLRVLGARKLDAMIIHPAMVYHRDGGVLTELISSAQKNGRVEVWGGLHKRWPVVHRDDLAIAYRLILENGRPSESYCVAAEKGVRVGLIAVALGRRFGLVGEPLVRGREEVVSEHGEWAVGPTLDQQMSGDKITRSLGWVPAHKDILSEIG
jgi:nucleoside-diphosphate-sugar epimerase